MKKVAPIPEGYHSITPYLIVKGAAKAIDFYKQAFGAIEDMRMPKPDGRIGHAQLTIGDSIIMLADEMPEMNYLGPSAEGNTAIGLYLYVENVDATVNKAVEAGATLVRPVENAFYGDRSGSVRDPFGHNWYIATHVEDVSMEELKKRTEAMYNE